MSCAATTSRCAATATAFVVQQYVPGNDRCLYSFHTYLDRNSNPLGFFVGRKIRTYPKDAGGSVYLELVHDPELVSLSMEVLHKMNYIGPIKIDFKRDPLRKKWYILECNARFTLWNYLGAACGTNLPQIALADLYGQAVTPPTTYRTNIRWLSFADDLRAFVREYHRDGDWTWPQWLWSLCSRKIYDVFSWRDPRPWLVCTVRYAKANLPSSPSGSSGEGLTGTNRFAATHTGHRAQTVGCSRRAAIERGMKIRHHLRHPRQPGGVHDRSGGH